MTRVLLLVMAAATSVLTFSCSAASTPPPGAAKPSGGQFTMAPPGWQQEWDRTLAAAKKEGQVLVYTATQADINTVLTKAFKERYGIELTWLAGTAAEITTKLIGEKRAGVHLADGYVAGGTTMLTMLKPEGILAPLDSLLILPEVKDGKAWQGGAVPFHDKDHTGISFIADYGRYVLVNTGMMRKEEITSYRDLLKPTYKGQIVLWDPTLPTAGVAWSATLVRNWGLEPTKDYLRQLVRQEPVLTRDPRQQVEWVARGKYPIALAPLPTIGREFIKNGAPVAYASVREKSKLAPGIGVIAVPVKPDHPNATAVFLNWLLSREGQTVTYKAYGQPSARADVPPEGIPPGFLRQPDEDFFLQDEEDYMEQSRMLTVNKEIFAPLFK